MLLLTVVGAVLVLVAVGRTWARGTAAGGLAVAASGSQISGLPGALALVGLASAVAVFAVRGAGRQLVGVLVVAAGLGAAAGAALGAGDSSTVDALAASRLALTGTVAEQVSHTLWPYVAVLGGLLLAAAGALTLLRGRDWPAMGARYEAPTAKAAAKSGANTPADLWKALDRGEDPTEG
ncbi:TIGR02234 family membrane protein [Streptomyces tateyamensis]|uniref:TIGR02234 family membrane protein n=2 Tax=Streptomyces tateyamensis TaxID=565073 RepID=A0A2V4NZY4_9ACTN|nr:TIGR02234 family membrane protein [Streptomyces tateyamensis]